MTTFIVRYSDALMLCHPDTLMLCHPDALMLCHPDALMLCHPNALMLCHPELVSGSLLVSGSQRCEMLKQVQHDREGVQHDSDGGLE